MSVEGGSVVSLALGDGGGDATEVDGATASADTGLDQGGSFTEAAETEAGGVAASVALKAEGSIDVGEGAEGISLGAARRGQGAEAARGGKAPRRRSGSSAMASIAAGAPFGGRGGGSGARGKRRQRSIGNFGVISPTSARRRRGGAERGVLEEDMQPLLDEEGEGMGGVLGIAEEREEYGIKVELEDHADNAAADVEEERLEDEEEVFADQAQELGAIGAGANSLDVGDKAEGKATGRGDEEADVRRRRR